ncbi:MAG: 2'-5' RNA ligase family protein [Crinalium sp.]
MDKNKRLFFIALLPPQDIQDYVTGIKQHFANTYNSKAALKSPPHITLQPPFEWTVENLPVLEECLQQFVINYSPIPITLSGFAAFVPRVIYVNVLKTLELISLQKELMDCVEASLGIVDAVSKKRPFAPHMTVGFKDLSKQNFKTAWVEFENQELHFEFIATHLTLLIHDGQRWQINSEFLLANNHG